MKRLLALIFIVAFVIALPFGATVARAENQSYKVIFDGTPIYAEPSRGEPVDYLDGGYQFAITATEVIDSDTYFAFIYNDSIVYIKSSAVYVVSESGEYSVSYVRATRTAESEEIKVYAEPRDDSKVIATFSDGTVLELVTKYDSDFYLINVGGKKGFVPVNNITTSLSYYQKIAIIVGAVVLAGVLAIILIQSLFKGKIKKSRTTSSFD